MKTTIGILLKTARVKQGLKVKDVAQNLNIDSSLISRFESGARLPSQKQVVLLAKHLNILLKDLMVAFLSQQLVKQYGTSDFFIDALHAAEVVVKYNQQAVTESTPKSLTEVLQKIDVIKVKLDKLRKLDSFKIAEALELEYTFNSNQIEGNTLTLQETHLVVNEGITIDGKSMREHLEAINHTDAIAFVKELVTKQVPISQRTILQLHELVLRGIDRQNAGAYRKVQVLITGSTHVPPAPYLIAKQMEDMMFWYESNKNTMHPVLLAAEMHERLVSIHPFIDGNGRTSRLLMNLILLQNGYVIADIKGDKRNRLSYYNALESVRNQNDGKLMFLDFIGQTELTSLKKYLTILQ